MDTTDEMDEASPNPIFKNKFYEYVLITSSEMDETYVCQLFKIDSINDEINLSQINYYDGEIVIRYKTDNFNEIKMFHDITFYQLKKLLRNEINEYEPEPKLQEIASKLYEFCSTLE